jgi:hypothetical protein
MINEEVHSYDTHGLVLEYRYEAIKGALVLGFHEILSLQTDLGRWKAATLNLLTQ